jgi:hypothetical protein
MAQRQPNLGNELALVTSCQKPQIDCELARFYAAFPISFARNNLQPFSGGYRINRGRYKFQGRIS